MELRRARGGVRCRGVTVDTLVTFDKALTDGTALRSGLMLIAVRMNPRDVPPGLHALTKPVPSRLRAPKVGVTVDVLHASEPKFAPAAFN